MPNTNKLAEEAERARFEAVFPMPAGVEWIGDGYEVKDSYANSYACDRYVAQWVAWLAAKHDAIPTADQATQGAEPVAWRFRVEGHENWMHSVTGNRLAGIKAIEACGGKVIDSEPLYTHPAPASASEPENIGTQIAKTEFAKRWDEAAIRKDMVDEAVTPEFLTWLQEQAPREGVASNVAWNAGVAWARASASVAGAGEALLTDERIDFLLDEAYRMATTAGRTNGGMVGHLWNHIAARAIEAEVRSLAARPVAQGDGVARKPLTRDGIFELAEPFGAFEFGDAQGYKRIRFARAIETAHGITGATHD